MGYRAKLVRLFTFCGGLYYFLEFVLPQTITLGRHSFQFGAYSEQISNGFILIGAMAIGLGLFNLLFLHGGRIVFHRQGWMNSVALLVGMGAMILISTRDWSATSTIASEAERFFLLRDFSGAIVRDAQVEEPASLPPVETRVSHLLVAANDELGRLHSLRLAHTQHERSPQEAATERDLDEALTRAHGALGLLKGPPYALDAIGAVGAALGQVGVNWRQLQLQWYQRTTTKQLYQLFFEGLFSALGTAMFALLGFYVATAAYRAFRIRSAESALMMAAALIVMLGQIPFGLWIADWLPEFRVWLLNTPSAAARRAIEIGAAVAGLVMAFRMWLSIESGSFGEQGKK